MLMGALIKAHGPSANTQDHLDLKKTRWENNELFERTISVAS